MWSTESSAQIAASWTNASGGTWNDGANWSTTPDYPDNGQPMPGDTYDATISLTPGAPYTVTLDTTTTLDNLTLNSADATLSHTTDSLVINGAIDLTDGTYRLSGGTISGGTLNGGERLRITTAFSSRLDGVTVNGQIEMPNQGRLQLVNSLTAPDGILISGSTARLGLFDSLTLTTDVELVGAGSSVSLEGSGTVTIDSAATVRGGNNSAIWWGWFSGGDTSSLLNQGTIRADIASTQFTVFPSGTNSVTNSGTLAATSGSHLVVNNLMGDANEVSLSDANSQVTLNGNYTVNQDITVAAGTTLSLGGTYTMSNASRPLNTGGTVDLRGTWDNSGENFTLDGTTGNYRLNGATVSGGTLNGGDRLRFVTSTPNRLSGVTINGPIEVGASRRIGLLNGTVANDDILVSGSGGVLGLFDTFTLTNDVDLEGTPSYLSLEGTGTVTIGPNVTVRGGNGSAIWWGFISGGGSSPLVNQGTIRADISGTQLDVFPSGTNSVTNTGTLAATNGAHLMVNNLMGDANEVSLSDANSQVTLNGDFTVNQDIPVPAGTMLSLRGTYTLSDASRPLNTGGTVNLSGSWDNSGGSFTLDATTGNYRLSGGTIIGGTLHGGERLDISNNGANRLDSVTVNGLLEVSNTQRIALQNGAVANDGILVSGNSGAVGLFDTITLTNDVALEGAGSHLTLEGNGTVTIGPTATVRGGNNGGIWWGFFSGGFNSSLVNQGTIRADIADRQFTVFSSGTNSVMNSGTLEATNGGELIVNNLTGDANGVTLTGADSQMTLRGDYALNQNVDPGDGTTLNLESDWDIRATLTVAAGSIVNTGDGLMTVSAGGVTDVQGGTFTANSDLAVPGGTLQIASGNLDAPGISLTSDTAGGTIEQTGGTLMVDTLTLAGDVFAGTYNLQGGTLRAQNVVGDLTNAGGTVAPGASPGTTTIDGNLVHNSGSVEIEIAGLIADTEHDQLVVTGTATVNGGDLALRGTGALPSTGDHTIVAVTAASVSGTFGVGLPAGSVFDFIGSRQFFKGLTHNATDVTVDVYYALDGDANGDRAVTASGDGGLLLSNLGAGGGKIWTDGDFNGDGVVTASQDGATLLANLGMMADTASPAVVPEPSTAWLLLAFLVVATLSGAGSRTLLHCTRCQRLASQQSGP